MVIVKPRHENRESWLKEAIEMFRVTFRDLCNVELPETIHVSMGLPDGKFGKGTEAIGQCWPTSRSEDGHNHVFICPTLADPIEVLNVLLHELIHVSDDCLSGHRGYFVEIMKAFGLGGKATSTTPGEMEPIFEAMVRYLGDFPHAALHIVKSKKPPTTVKAGCLETDYHVRISFKWVREFGYPKCPCCNRRMVNLGGE